jgi:hypothetical protein
MHAALHRIFFGTSHGEGQRDARLSEFNRHQHLTACGLPAHSNLIGGFDAWKTVLAHPHGGET